jgi:hypothetical protein
MGIFFLNQINIETTYLNNIHVSAVTIHDSVAILSSLQPILSLEKRLQPLHVLTLKSKVKVFDIVFKMDF